jgi:hypothetical protein
MWKLPSSLFWSTFFTSPDGNPLIGRDKVAAEAKAVVEKKGKWGGSDPTFFGFQPPK